MPYYKTNRHINIILFIGIMLVAANLRAPITSVGVALPSIKDTLHTTNSALSFMTVVLSLHSASSFSHLKLEMLSV